MHARKIFRKQGKTYKVIYVRSEFSQPELLSPMAINILNQLQ